MLSLPPTVRIYFALDPVDLRKGFDELSNVTRSLLDEDPMSGHLFVFINRRGNRAKILFWDRSGWCIYYKRIEQGTFRPPQRRGLGDAKVEIEAAELMLILEGIELAGAQRRLVKIFAREGMTMSVSTMVGWVRASTRVIVRR